ncbi:hypothetical protein BDU57DRAFT_543625 [Ampelomyces quisqualis]|uniref:Uncharacterized protein n=1 Tax=Ampelomyces quisqualis TaxID=50730 RepID=A0A6A5Q8R6_AMPQU|nr:hypothetical protein BDU57DRAFT_543625 [Ampelomyces quisqualis]
MPQCGDESVDKSKITLSSPFARARLSTPGCNVATPSKGFTRFAFDDANCGEDKVGPPEPQQEEGEGPQLTARAPASSAKETEWSDKDLQEMQRRTEPWRIEGRVRQVAKVDITRVKHRIGHDFARVGLPKHFAPILETLRPDREKILNNVIYAVETVIDVSQLLSQGFGGVVGLDVFVLGNARK